VKIHGPVARAVACYQFAGDGPPLFLVDGQVDLEGLQSLLHAPHMWREADQGPIVGRDDLVDAVAEQEAAIHGGDARLVHRQVIAVEIDRTHNWEALSHKSGGSY
jgi:hypothetical protein